MLRAAQKQIVKTGQSLNQSSSSIFFKNITKRNVRVRQLSKAHAEYIENRMAVYDIIGQSIGGVGIVKMNKEHRNNLLTPQYVKQVARGVESMNIDHFVKLIYLTTSQGKHFSNGTDFRTILQFIEEKKYDQLADYIADIFKLQATMAKINKPILAAAPGHSYNSGLGILSACSLPAISHNTRVAYNECTFGFVPHAGTTFYASRMPGDLGTFMVLTGTSVHGKDAINIGIAELLIDQPETYDEDVIDCLTNVMSGTLPGSREVHDSVGIQQYKRRLNHEVETEFKVDQMLKTEKSYEFEQRRRSKFYQHDELFIDPKERKPDIVAQADIEYEQILKRHSQANFGQGGQSYFSHIPEDFNSFQYINDYAKSMLGDKYQEEIVNTLLKHRQLIDRCFWSNSIEEIMENLRNEDDKFAKEILQRMEANSMLSMKLALQMIRKAKNMCFRDVLNMEVNVALNKVQDSDFKIGVENILMKQNNYGKHIARQNPGYLKNVPNELVDSYFKENEYAKKIDLDIIENSLLPTRHYFNTHTDSLRIYVNETSTNQEEVRDAVEMEIKEVLRYQGIDLRNKTLTIPQIRKLIYQQEREKMYEDEQLKRAIQLLTDQKLRNNYFDKIISHVNSIDKNEKQFYELVNNKINNIFENAFLQRLDQIYQKSQEAHGLEKRRMFIKFKKFLIRSRILQFHQEEALRQDIQIQALPFKLPHMSEKWDESFRDQEHPQIQKSIMYHLSKVIGKATIAPYESIKLFLTDREAAQSLSTFVLDKKQLENLRKDLIENTDKYEKILTQEDEYDSFYDPSDVADLLKIQTLKAENQQYKFRLYNDGWIESLRNWPWRVQYHQYKNWSSEIKKKSLDTLKYTVQRLISDFQNDQFIGNKVEEFNEQKGESKRQKLERLLNLLNQKQDDIIQHDKKQQQDERTLNQKQISIKSLNDQFNQLIEDDKDLKNFLGSKDNHKNILLSKFRENLISQLLQLIETVLISSENSGINLQEKEIEQRLAQILQPKNIQNDNQIQLKIIDSYLYKLNSQNTLKKTFEFVKPFFIEMILKEIEIETEKVLDGFKINNMNTEVLRKYLLLKNNPHMYDYGIFEKIEQYSEINEIEKHIEENQPTESAKFITANALNKIGQNIDDTNSGLTTKQREQKVIENAREHMILASLISHKQNVIDQKIQKQVEDEKINFLNSPFKGYDKYIEKAEKALNGSEIEQLNIFMQYSQDIDKTLANKQYEINSLLKPHDWLLMCSELVLNFNVDMNQFMHCVLPKDQIINDLQNGNYNQEQVLKKKFNDNNLTWEQFAEYGNYLTNFLKEKVKLQYSEKYQNNYKKVVEFMLQTDKKENQNLTRESLFQTIINSNLDLKPVQMGNYKNINEISDLKQFQKQISEQAKLKLEILRISKFLNEDMKNEIENLLNFDSKYLHLESILQRIKILHQKSKQEQNAKTKEKLPYLKYIDQNKILRDIQKGNLLQEFIQKFNDYKLDVVSMAEIRHIVNISKNESQEVNKNQNIEFFLSHLENQLQYVSNARREQISLGQFLSRHHFYNDDSMRNYSNELIQIQLENALGKSLKQNEIGAQFDNQLEGILSHPAIENQQFLNQELDIQIDKVLYDASKGEDTKNIKSKIAVKDLGKESYSVKDKADDMRQKCIENAKKLTNLNQEMETIKNLYENKLLIEFTKAEINQELINHLIKEYMQARYNDCMVKKEFSEAMKTENKHIYLKVLRQRVLEEMKLTESMDINELSWVYSEENVQINQTPQYFIDSLYNLDQLNNEEAIGYSNLAERAADQENNRNIAHQSVFDKLLADYFLQARSQHKKGNKLLTDLEEIFGNFSSPSLSGEKARKYDEISKLEGQTGIHSLGLQYQLQAANKDDQPYLPMYNFKALMDLDITINKYFYDGKSGLSQQMRNKPDEIQLIPDFYEFLDVRMPADQYVTRKLEMILEQLFEARRKVEKYLSRQELIAYDQSMLKYLNKQSLMEKLRRDLYKDYNQIDLMEQGYNHMRDSDKSLQVQLMKTKNEQPQFNKDVQNEDAFYKFLAYTGNLEKQRRENRKQTLSNFELLGGEQSFEQFYQKQLMDSAKMPPRPINNDDYIPKRKKITEELYLKQKSGGDDDLGYMSRAQKQEKFFEEHSLYQENQLEQKERIELFYVLQKFFNNQQQNKMDHNDPLFKAQESIKEYFSKPENTNFFEKNKIY